MKAQQRMNFLCQLRKLNLLQQQLVQFYNTAIQSLLCASVIVWIGLATKEDKNRLEQRIRPAERKKWCQPAFHSSPDWGNRQVASLYTISNPHILDKICFSFSPQRSATCLWTLKQWDTRTAYSHRASLCWTFYQTVNQATYTYNV